MVERTTFVESGRAAAARLRPRRRLGLRAARRARDRVQRGAPDDRRDRGQRRGRGAARGRAPRADARGPPPRPRSRRRAARVVLRHLPRRRVRDHDPQPERAAAAGRRADADRAAARRPCERGAADRRRAARPARGGASPSAVVIPTPETTSTTRTPGSGALTMKGSPGARRVDAVPALPHRRARDAEQPPRLGEQQLVEPLLAERRRRVAVVVGVADDQIAVRQLRDDQVDPRRRQLRALAPAAARARAAPPAAR